MVRQTCINIYQQGNSPRYTPLSTSEIRFMKQEFPVYTQHHQHKYYHPFYLHPLIIDIS